MSSFGNVRKDWKPGTLASEPGAHLGFRVAIFGGTGGLGRAIAESLLNNGAEVTVLGRTLKEPPHPRRSFVAVDLSSLISARAVARDLAAESFDAVLLTHGIFAGRTREVTAEGLEKDLATSAMSRWATGGSRKTDGGAEAASLCLGLPGRRT
jgi:NAD(P)-dependent dehydrogenase (short-subunit alcohol dehydrogenase family)